MPRLGGQTCREAIKNFNLPLETAYEKALSIQLTKLGIPHESQCPIQIPYDNQIVGDFICDLFVDGLLINFGTAKVELKGMSRKASE